MNFFLWCNMNRFQIKDFNCDQLKITDMEYLSRNIGIDSQIFEIYTDGSIVNLGVLNRRALAYICRCVCKHIFDNSILKEKDQFKNMFHEIIFKLDRWLEDQASVTQKEFDNIIARVIYFIDAGYKMYIFRMARYSLLLACEGGTVNFQQAMFSAAQSSEECLYSTRQVEFSRQGEFIIEFMKSNNFLFYL